MNPKNLLFFGCLALGVGLDQATKRWVFHNIPERTGEIVVIPDFFSLVHSENPGAVFGSLAGQGEWRIWLFLAFTVVAIGLIGNLWWQLPSRARLLPALYGFILSGAVGNAIDRIIKGEVTDFFQVYTEIPGLKDWLVAWLGTSAWPAFNVADICLSVGVTLFVIYEFFFNKEGDKEPDAPPAESG